MPRPEEISNEPTRAVVDDMMQQTEQALQSSARAAAELNELRQRADDALDWKKQLNRHSWLAMGLAMAASVVVFLAFQRRR
jgi:ElaB/YqjD/DUF883 family membrane-anchored ribosome-binding protein